jgi:ABC-type multidrug transport system fused ATPase/permease subunit
MCRFYDPDEGRILLDGVDLRSLDQEALRRRIAVLFQDPVHYHASVRENIAFGDIEGLGDQARVWEAARNAGALEPIERLKGGFRGDSRQVVRRRRIERGGMAAHRPGTRVFSAGLPGDP